MDVDIVLLFGYLIICCFLIWNKQSCAF